MTNIRLSNLIEMMNKNSIDYMIIPTNDYHNGEDIHDYFKVREYFSGFNGSSGTLLVNKDESLLWVDGRYYLQGEIQLENSGIKLMKMGLDVTLEEYLYTHVRDKNTICVDAKLFSMNFIMNLRAILSDYDINYIYDNEKIINAIWTNRVEAKFSNPIILDECFAGYSVQDKVNALYKMLDNDDMSCYIISDSESINYLLNIRGNDYNYTPVCCSFMIVTSKYINLYIHNVSDDIKIYLNENNIVVKDYNDIYKDIEQLRNHDIALDYNVISYYLAKCINNKYNTVNHVNDYLSTMKCVKSDIEISNMQKAHEIDAISMIKFIRYVKDNANNNLSELDYVSYIDNLRYNTTFNIALSFKTICGYNEHGAIVHYSVDEFSNKIIKGNGLLLIDSGGHYFYGTTDITRTIGINKVNDKMKEHYTLVLKGLISLSRVRFKKGRTLNELDVLARKFLWDKGLDYNHGTGHGVGYLLNVHEDIKNNYNDKSILLKNMITSIEPGVYIENEYGIRLENLVNVCEDIMLYFNTLTLVPFDKDCINVKMLDDDEIKWLNDYHNNIISVLNDDLSDDDISYIKYNLI